MIVPQLLLVSGLLFGAPATKEVKAELAKIQGTWKGVGGEKHGKKADEAIKQADMTLVIKNDKWTIAGIEEGQTTKSEKTGTLELNLGTDPKSMDMVFEGGGKLLAIYKLDGDKLIICFGMKRPKDFETDVDNFERLIVYERQRGQATSAVEFATADEAYQAGALFLNRNEDAKSQKPLEAALKLAPNDTYKVKVYQALTRPYYLLPQPEKMFEAIEFIVDKSESAAERSLARTALISYLQPRAKTEVAITRYEELLKKDANNKTALYLLSEVYNKLRPNPKRGAEIGEKLAEVMNKEGGEIDVNQAAQLAAQYIKAGKLKEGAELYEKIADKDAKLSAWHWKEAASAWLKFKDKEKALAAAKASDSAPPESRSDLLAHFWNRSLGDIYLQLGEPKLAIPHYEQAIEKTNIEGYLKDTKASLADACAKAGVTATRTGSTAGNEKPSGKSSGSGNAAQGSVDLNTASLEELTAIDGVSEDLAIQIIDRRKQKPFKSVSELIEFDTVDKGLLAKLRKSLKVGSKK